MTKAPFALLFASGLLPASLHAATQPEIHVAESLPAGFSADGDLGEWAKLAPNEVGPANQVAGPVKIGENGDFSAKIWVAITTKGLAVAGQVTDDKVRLSANEKQIHADHAELWLALPAAAMPPLAYANQFGETEVPDAAACDTLEEIEEPDECKAWVAEQRRRRRSFEKLFIRQYLFTTAGLAETWSAAGANGATPAPQRACCGASKAVVKPAPGGWVFEARIGAADFPATSQVPLRDLALLIDFADADDQSETLESFVSTSPRRKFARPTTFNAVTLHKGLIWETEPPLLARFAKGHSIFFFPGLPMKAAHYFQNPAVGYQYSPSEPSPAVVTMKYGDPAVATLGDLKVYWAASPHGHGLYAVRNDVVVDGVASEGELVAQVKRSGTKTLQFLMMNVGTRSPLGTGACGSCPVHRVRIFSLDETGSFKELLDEEVGESMPPDDSGGMLEDVKLAHEKEFIRVGFVGTKLDDDGGSKPWKRYWKWNAKKKAFVREK